MNTGNKNGRPKSERNIQIIADSKAGMTSLQLAEKYNMTYGYVQKIASEYKRRDRRTVEEMHVASMPGLYSVRDRVLMEHYQRLGA